MLQQLWNWWQFNFSWGLACFLVGLAVISPFLVRRSFRKWLARKEFDLEGIGLIVIIVSITAIGIYNQFNN
jgi:hypothetical protein